MMLASLRPAEHLDASALVFILGGVYVAVEETLEDSVLCGTGG